MPLLRGLPTDATLVDLRNMFPDLLDKLRPYAQRLMRGPSPLTAKERELIAAFVSGVNSCRYCYGAHSRVAEAFGVEEATLTGLLDDIETAPIDKRLKSILRYVRKLTESPSRMTVADAAAVYEAGWNDEALLHAVSVCAYFNNMNRLVEGTGIVGKSEDYTMAASRLVNEGYKGVNTRKNPKSRNARGSKSAQRDKSKN